jgi:hypothetical protein
MKRNFLPLLAALLLSGAAFGQQGVAFEGPAIMSQVPQPIAGLTITICNSTATGNPCNAPITVYSDAGLQTPISSLATDGDGLIPIFFVSPGQYQWCASDPVQGRIVPYCKKFTAPATNGSSPSFVNVTATGTVTAAITNGVVNAAQQSGSDICAKVNAAESALPTAGGEIDIPAGQYTSIATTCVLSKPTYLRCSNPGFGSTTRPCLLSFNAGVSGLTCQTAAQWSRVEGIYFQGNATVAGSDIGILDQCHAFHLEDVTVDGFGNKNISVNASSGSGTNANSWYFVNVRAADGKDDGFFFSGTDANAGTCINCDTFGNAGWGFNIGSTVFALTFLTPEADSNVLGGYQTAGLSSVFENVYTEPNATSSFIFTAASHDNYVIFNTNAQATTITDSGTNNFFFSKQGGAGRWNKLNSAGQTIVGLSTVTGGGGTSALLGIEATTTPGMYWRANGAAADNKVWDAITSNGSDWLLRAVNDANNSAGIAIDCARGGLTVTGCTFPAGIIVGSNGTKSTLMQHKRISTGSIGATTRTEILLSWTNTFTDTNYTVACNVEDSTTAAGTQGLTFERIRTKSATQVGAVINNPTAGAITGTIDCTANHD